MRTIAVLCSGGSMLAALGAPRLSRSVALPHLPAGIVAAAGAGLVAALVAAAVAAPSSIAVASGVLVSPLPIAAAKARAHREVANTAARWPDFLAAVRSRISAGTSVPEATRHAAAHVGGRYVELARGPGIPFAQVMADARESWSDPLADRVFTTLAAAADIGGRHVDAVLSTLAASIGDELRLRRAHDAALTEQRLTAGVALVAPWAMLGLSVATNPTASSSFSSATGSLIVGIGLIATVLGYVLSRRAARLSQPPRLFG